MFDFLHSVTNHLGQNTNGPSPRIWRHLHGASMPGDGNSRLQIIGDDFRTFGLCAAVASNVGRYVGECGQYKSYEDTGGSIAGLATEHTGVVRFTTDTTDNDENWLQSGDSLHNFALLSDTAASDYLQCFECRVRFDSVADSRNWFIGLAEEGLAAADTIADGGTMADKDFIGFHSLEADGDAAAFAYNKESGTTAEVGTTVVAADTWYKLGFVYNPEFPTSKRIKWYVDNVEQSSYVTGTVIASANFPDGEELSFLAGHKNGGAAAELFDIDWWRYGVLVKS